MSYIRGRSVYRAECNCLMTPSRNALLTCDCRSAPSDANAALMRFIVLPASFDLTWPDYQIEGGGIPQYVLNAGVEEGSVNRVTGQPLNNVLPNGNNQGGPPPPPPPPPQQQQPPAQTGAGTIALTAFPSNGGLGPVSGVVSGLQNPKGYEVVMYVRDGGGVNYW